ncbi:MAG: sporulation protein YunB [Clostridia bacterium]|nr:sporulation protein YunB [Clostridia bacterium]
MQSASFRMTGSPKRSKKSNRSEKGGKRRGSGGLFSFLLIVTVITVAIILALNYILYPAITTVARSKAQSTTHRMLSSAVNRHIINNPALYSDFIRISYNSDGSVSALETNVANLNFVCSSIMLELLKDFKEIDTFSEKIPLGSIFGSNANSGMGPDLTVKISVLQTMNAHMESSFTEVGINQTRHRIMFAIEIDLCAIMPSGREEFSVKNSICIAETVIVGAVPEAYTKINRLTDDISESEIDDIYDFGATKK